MAQGFRSANRSQPRDRAPCDLSALRRPGHRAYPCSDMDGHATPFVSAFFALPVWIPRVSGCPASPGLARSRARIGPPSSDRRKERIRRPRCAWRGGRRISTAGVDHPVVGVELMTPMRVAVGAEQLGRADDIGEEDRREHAFVRPDARAPRIRNRGWPRPSSRRPGAHAVPAEAPETARWACRPRAPWRLQGVR